MLDLANFIMLALGLVIGIISGRRMHARGIKINSGNFLREGPLITGTALGLLLVSVSVSVMSAIPALAFRIPLVIEYYYGLGIFWLPTLFSIALLAGASVSLIMLEKIPFRHVLAFVLLLTLLCLPVLHKLIVLPGSARLGPPRVTEDGIILQSTSTSCVAAACANAVGFFGIKKSEEEMAGIIGSKSNTPSLAEAIYGLRRLGLKASKVCVPQCDARKLIPPAILLVDAEGGTDGHVVTYMGNDGITLEIWDPLFGKSRWGDGELREIWHGRAIQIER